MTKPYPDPITLDQLPHWAHVSDDEIARDIAETEREIEDYRALEAADRVIADHHPNELERRLARFRADARPSQIVEREALVAFLRRIQTARAAAPRPEGPA